MLEIELGSSRDICSRCGGWISMGHAHGECHAASNGSRSVARKCSICGFLGRSPDHETPFRCDACYVRSEL
jgi:hypothetical protein